MGEENVGVGGEDHQQSFDHIDTSKRGKDAFMHAGVQPQQDPRDTDEWHRRERERRHLRPALIGPSLGVGEERERERERMTRRGCLQGLAESGNALFFTMAFIP